MTNNFKQCVALAALMLGATAVAQAQNPVTFSVDMSKLVLDNVFTNDVNVVEVQGSFQGWTSGYILTNDPALTDNSSNIYSGTFDITDSIGTVEQYKFVYQPGGNYENPDSTCGNNRMFTLAGGAQTLPTVYWNDQPLVLPTNNVTFQVDMTAQINITGAFVPGTSIVYCRGSFENWGSGNFSLTNDPALSGNASNIYSGTWPLAAVPGACESYKFYIDTGANWESPASTGGNNRTFHASDGPQTLPVFYFNDASPGDFLPVDTAVTFNVNMTNAVGTDGTVFNPSSHNVYLNGDFLGWWTWGALPPSNYQMTNNPPGSWVYSLTVVRPKGTTLPLTYKYSIDGPDNEYGFGINHFRYVRQTPNYSMPLDIFGTNSTPVSEPYPGFGGLTAGAVTGGQIPVSWLGRPGVQLETTEDLAVGPWADLFQTDGTNWTAGYSGTQGFVSVTNYPASAPATFFRLIKH